MTDQRAARRAQAAKVIAGLAKLYPRAHCELDFKTPLQLLVATILSAQCTDVRVNRVTPGLFRKYTSARALSLAPLGELEQAVRSTGFFRSKAASIKSAAAVLAEKFHGEVPRTMEELLELRGVARKTANVVLGSAYGIASGIVVDTHMKRLAYRLGLSDEQDPVKIERDLMDAVPKNRWIWFGHAMVWHGRRVCSARAPDCPGCGLKRICPKRGV